MKTAESRSYQRSQQQQQQQQSNQKRVNKLCLEATNDLSLMGAVSITGDSAKVTACWNIQKPDGDLLTLTQEQA